jgi:hypothetical protein
MMPTGKETVLSAQELVTAPIQIDTECIDRIRTSRFGFLVASMRTTELIDALRIENFRAW